MRKKSSHFRTSSSLNMAVRGGLTRFARPAGSPLTAFVVCPTGCASCRTPVGASHPPWSALCEKKLALSYELFFKYGGEGGIDSLRSPCGQPTHCVRGLSNWLRQLSNPGRGFSPPWSALCEKKLALSYELFFKYGGEGGIRTPDTLPYTHFPGVLLQPLGHLTKLFCRLTSWGQRGATIGSWSKTVKKNFNDNYCLLIL
ncbi:ybl54 [Escherichia coli BL21(DE3)]|nr:ybl54 [Escherichia coli BL21(DE3)]